MLDLKIKSLKIGCHKYSVKAVPSKDLDDNTIGQIGLYTGKILVDNSHSRQSIAQVLVHEIFHGIFFDAGNPITRKKEEKLICTLSPRMSAFLTDNPTEVRELLKMLR